MIVIDSREPQNLKEKVSAAIADSQVQWLPTADYLIFDEDGHTIGIERKATKDLLNSIAERKLKRQLDGLAQYDRGILLVEGHWTVRDGSLYVNNRRVGWKPASVQAILLALQEQTGVKLMWTSGFDETLITLRMLEGRGRKGCFWPKDGGE